MTHETPNHSAEEIAEARRKRDEDYTKPYEELTPHQLHGVMMLASKRGEAWKIREMMDYINDLIDTYEGLLINGRMLEQNLTSERKIR